jgi:arginine-tRNA-protein transferase
MALSAESPCPYLPGHAARSEVYSARGLDGSAYEKLLARNFRRSGGIVYRPRCRACAECRQVRVLVDAFRPSRSQRRVWRANRDLRVEMGPPEPTAERHRLYVRYLDARHGESMSREWRDFVAFLYTSPLATLEVRYLLGDRLVAASLLDVCPEGWSSVYAYFEPDLARRSLGTYSVLWEIEACRRSGRPHYYLGYHVAGSPAMDYKARFRPQEVLVEGRWVLRGA